MEVLLKGVDLYKTYDMGETKIHALNGINFEIYNNEFLVILGPSGSGKSTLLNILGGMDNVTSGELYYKGEALHGKTQKQLTQYRKEAVGFVFQFYNLMPNLTAIENIDLAREIADSPLSSKEMLDKVGLSDRSDHFPAQLSGGQQQRVAIARALAKNPDILLCDEPTGALDTKSGDMVLEILKDFADNYGKTVVLITHNVSIAAMANRVIHVRDGKIEKIEKVGKGDPE